MELNLDEQLIKLKELLRDYEKTANEFLHHHNDEHYRHLIHCLRERLIYLEEIHKKKDETDAEKKTHFLLHHLDVIQHANEHWNHIRHNLTHLFEAAELEELYHRMQRLMKEIEKEKYELENLKRYNESHNRGPQPNPKPYINPEKKDK